MTLRDVLLDPEIFDDPLEFRPQRWLSDNPELDRIGQAYLPFGRGSRMCIGLKCVLVTSSTLTFPVCSDANSQSLALAEMHILLACLFRRFDLTLYDTSRERDIDVVRDCFIGEASPESKGVKVKLVK